MGRVHEAEGTAWLKAGGDRPPVCNGTSIIRVCLEIKLEVELEGDRVCKLDPGLLGLLMGRGRLVLGQFWVFPQDGTQRFFASLS